MRSKSRVRQTHVTTQAFSELQRATAHADASPSQSPSSRQGTRNVLVVVLDGIEDDVLVEVVDDVEGARIGRTRVVVVGPGGEGVVVLGPLVLAPPVVVVVTTMMHAAARGRQRSTSFAGAAPGSRTTRVRSVLRAGTVSVWISQADVPQTGTANEQTPSH